MHMISRATSILYSDVVKCNCPGVMDVLFQWTKQQPVSSAWLQRLVLTMNLAFIAYCCTSSFASMSSSSPRGEGQSILTSPCKNLFTYIFQKTLASTGFEELVLLQSRKVGHKTISILTMKPLIYFVLKKKWNKNKKKKFLLCLNIFHYICFFFLYEYLWAFATNLNINWGSGSVQYHLYIILFFYFWNRYILFNYLVDFNKSY